MSDKKRAVRRTEADKELAGSGEAAASVIRTKEPKEEKGNKASVGQLNRLTYRILSTSLWIFVILSAVAAIIWGTRFAYDTGYRMFDKDRVRPVEYRDEEIVINNGAGNSEVASLLLERKLIDDKTVFLLDIFFFDYKIQPGTYVINTTWNERKILDCISRTK